MTLKIAGPGSLNYYLTNGAGPVSQIDLSDTDPAKTVVSVKVKKPSTGGGNGRFEVGEIAGTGVRTLSLAAADLVGPGINLSSFLGSLTIRTIKNGADITLTVRRLRSDVQPRLRPASLTMEQTSRSLRAAGQSDSNFRRQRHNYRTERREYSHQGESENADRAGESRRFQVEPDHLRRQFGTHIPALKSLQVAGAISGSTIRVGGGIGTTGDVGSVSTGSFVNSTLFACYTGPTTDRVRSTCRARSDRSESQARSTRSRTAL